MGEETQPQPAHRDKFHSELENLKTKLLELAGLAGTAVAQSISATVTRDPDLARRVIQGDAAINDLEVFIDGECIRLVALYQPVAVDLRLLMAVDHIIAELERIGDQAVNIAEEALNLISLPERPLHPDLQRLACHVQEMLAGSLQAFLKKDVQMARRVCRADDEADALDRSIIQDLLVDMAARCREIVPADQSQITIVRNLERMGDHATNIAEQVVYMVEGENVRHRCQG
jgi:phosphate transport system protein